MSDEIILYTSPDGEKRVEVYYQGETVWLTQKQLAELFDVDVRTISDHLQAIFESRELSADSVIRKIRITAADGKAYLTNLYNLDAIISVGYRVNSEQATRFRIWATQTLREFIIKGFALDDERLKQNKRFGRDYFDELLERIREIRAAISSTVSSEEFNCAANPASSGVYSFASSFSSLPSSVGGKPLGRAFNRSASR
ncbi:MAG: virulence RhuM family protein [Chloroflexi bacterium]|nr:virulence RhuM family protein [Chloroflexota bacterium]